MGAIADARAEVQRAVGREAGDLMPYVADVSVPGSPVNAGDGTFTEGEGSSFEGVPCDIHVLSSYERFTGGALTANANYALEFPVYWDSSTVTIPPNATVTVEETDVEPSRVFEVVGPLPSSSIWKQRVSATLKG